ncbi:DUF5606 domain-containing protein [Segetibacter sp. 3557_3]|uniref:DUF5606 family protein n=1 Tax=Segetibacter sp. 3557_3 TaxID=2547429 RepID=UPI001404EA87|nr:DUF5606 domain-containing protein [Segetibacter sp. 3557_3]
MEYGKIIAISGMAGLFELVGSKKDGAIVRSLEDKSTKFVSSRIHNFSHLESIEVYTTGENVNLVDVLQAIKQSGEATPSEKDNAAIKAFFEKVYPELDFERVYASDMKKMVKWYTILSANDVEFKLTQQSEEAEDDAAEDVDVTDQPLEAVEASTTEGAAETVSEDSELVEAAETTEEPGSAKKKAPKKKKSEEE